MVKEINDKVMDKLKSFNVAPLMPALRFCNDGAIEDILNINGNAYYQWATCYVDLYKPKQVVELGGAMGVWDLMVLQTLPEDSMLYSITLEEHGLEFSFIKEIYKNFHPIVGDDLDMKNWEGVNLSNTDLWFFDSLHTKDQLTKELTLYTQFFKKGSIVLFDDIRTDELWPVWQSLPYKKLELTNPCHYSGFGMVVI